jgi:hypothetical protein
MNTTFTRLLCLFLTCCFYAAAPAQSRIVVYENTTQHPPRKPSPWDKKAHFLGPGESALKINLSSLFRSDFCLSYEKKLSRLYSAELTAGLTRYDKITEAFDFFNYHPRDMVQARRQYSLSPSVKAGIRYYFETNPDEISGPYLSVEGMYRRYGYTIKNNYTTPSLAKEHSDQREIRFLYGWQNSDVKEVAFYDCSIGVGYRFHERTYLGYDVNNFAAKAMTHSTKNYFVFVINIKAGFMLH